MKWKRSISLNDGVRLALVFRIYYFHIRTITGNYLGRCRNNRFNKLMDGIQLIRKLITITVGEHAHIYYADFLLITIAYIPTRAAECLKWTKILKIYWHVLLWFNIKMVWFSLILLYMLRIYENFQKSSNNNSSANILPEMFLSGNFLSMNCYQKIFQVTIHRTQNFLTIINCTFYLDWKNWLNLD